MKITLDTGTTYDLSLPNEVKNLKSNISKMAAQKKVARLAHLYQQVKPYQKYSGNDIAFKNACSICCLLGKYKLLQIKTPAKKEPLKMSDNKKTSTTVYGSPDKACIQISYRQEQGRSMHGAFYDHYVMRKITENSTSIVSSPNVDTNTFKDFTEKNASHELALNPHEHGKKVFPTITHDLNDSGLLFIPGRDRKDNDIVRRQFEKELIKKALNRGQPILAICAGSWQLWEMFGGETRSVEGHCYANMPRILERGGVGNNVGVHRITLEAHTIVAGAMNLPKVKNLETYPIVNSVHWEAPDESKKSPMVDISARALADKAIAPNNRQGSQMDPTVGSVEAFEGRYGAPIVGIQWHPEAYYKISAKEKTPEDKRHLNLINAMAKAGNAYAAKKKMLTEFKNQCLLNKNGFFASLNKLTPKQISDEKKHDPLSIHYQEVKK